MLSQVEALLDMPRECFLFNVFGNYKFNSCWGRKVIASQKEKSQLFKRLHSSYNHVLFNDWEIPGAGKKMSLCTNEVILVFTGPVHSSSCFLFHVL